MQLPQSSIDAVLDRWPIARLASAGADGPPHQVPIVFARSDGALWSPIDGKPKQTTELARLRRIAREPRVSVLLDHYEADWSRLWWLRVDARAEVVRLAACSAPQAARARAAVAALERKYPQYAETPVLRDPPTLLRIEPLAQRSWCAGTPPDAATLAEAALLS